MANFRIVNPLDSGTANANTGSLINFGGGSSVELEDGIADLFVAGSAADFIFAGNGDDTLFGANGADFLAGQIGNDSLIGGTGDDSLVGGLGGDSLDGVDILLGNDGNDLMGGGAGADLLIGDTLDVSGLVMGTGCWRAVKTDQPCALNFDQALLCVVGYAFVDKSTRL